MIDDNTVLTPLRWQQYESSGESFRIADEKYNAIIKYIFVDDYNDNNFYFEKEGICIGKWGKRATYRGIKLEYYDILAHHTIWRTIEFKGTAECFKKNVLLKIEMLKAKKEEANKKVNLKKMEDSQRSEERDELQKVANEKFSKNPRIRTKINSTTHITLDIHFDTKQELIDFVNNTEITDKI